MFKNCETIVPTGVGVELQCIVNISKMVATGSGQVIVLMVEVQIHGIVMQ